MERQSFSLKLLSGDFYGQSFIKTVRGPLMIFDLLTSPQGLQLGPRMKILLAFCSVHHIDLICHMTMFEKKIFF